MSCHRFHEHFKFKPASDSYVSNEERTRDMLLLVVTQIIGYENSPPVAQNMATFMIVRLWAFQICCF